MKLLDTETIVEQLRKKEHEFGAISIITLIEVLRGVKEQYTRSQKTPRRKLHGHKPKQQNCPNLLPPISKIKGKRYAPTRLRPPNSRNRNSTKPNPPIQKPTLPKTKRTRTKNRAKETNGKQITHCIYLNSRIGELSLQEIRCKGPTFEGNIHRVRKAFFPIWSLMRETKTN